MHTKAAATAENQPVEDPPMSGFVWTIENFTRLNAKKHYSDVFVAGGYKWYGDLVTISSSGQTKENNSDIFFFPPCINRRILIFPKGNNVDHLSMYLDVADSSSLLYSWSRYAQFSLFIVNQLQGKYTVRKGILLILPISQWHILCSLV